jgi:hypothetical protein
MRQVFFSDIYTLTSGGRIQSAGISIENVIVFRIMTLSETEKCGIRALRKIYSRFSDLRSQGHI